MPCANEPSDATIYTTSSGTYRQRTGLWLMAVDNMQIHIYTDTTSPVASQLQTRLFLCVSAFRKYDITQLDLTNAYLHAPIQDVVYIIIPEGFPNADDVARLRKAAYGTKQGARRFYDHTANIFKQIGLVQCPNEHCLFRYLLNDDEAFIIRGNS